MACPPMKTALSRSRSLSSACNSTSTNGHYSTDPGPTVAAILAYVSAQGDKLVDLRVERPSLEERFLEITNSGGTK